MPTQRGRQTAVPPQPAKLTEARAYLHMTSRNLPLPRAVHWRGSTSSSLLQPCCPKQSIPQQLNHCVSAGGGQQHPVSCAEHAFVRPCLQCMLPCT